MAYSIEQIRLLIKTIEEVGASSRSLSTQQDNELEPFLQRLLNEGLEGGSSPVNTDDLSEGSNNLYYTEGRVSANTDVAANTGARHQPATLNTGNSTTTDALNINGAQQVITARLATSSRDGIMPKDDKEKLDTVEENANPNVQADWTETDDTEDSYIQNKPDFSLVPSPENLSINKIAGNTMHITLAVHQLKLTNLNLTGMRCVANLSGMDLNTPGNIFVRVVDYVDDSIIYYQTNSAVVVDSDEGVVFELNEQTTELPRADVTVKVTAAYTTNECTLQSITFDYI